MRMVRPQIVVLDNLRRNCEGEVMRRRRPSVTLLTLEMEQPWKTGHTQRSGCLSVKVMKTSALRW